MKRFKVLDAALQTTGESELEITDPDTQRIYVVIDAEIHRQAMDALQSTHHRSA